MAVAAASGPCCAGAAGSSNTRGTPALPGTCLKSTINSALHGGRAIGPEEQGEEHALAPRARAWLAARHAHVQQVLVLPPFHRFDLAPVGRNAKATDEGSRTRSCALDLAVQLLAWRPSEVELEQYRGQLEAEEVDVLAGVVVVGLARDARDVLQQAAHVSSEPRARRRRVLGPEVVAEGHELLRLVPGRVLARGGQVPRRAPGRCRRRRGRLGGYPVIGNQPPS